MQKTETMIGRIIALTMEAVWHTVITPRVAIRTSSRRLVTTQRFVRLSSDVLRTTSAVPERRSTTPAVSSCSPSTFYSPIRTMKTKVDGGELVIATMDDYQQVVNLRSNVYQGLDYLPSTFPHLVQGPGAKSFLCYVEGELVGFIGSMILDRGQTALWMSGRVKETWQGHGIFSEMTNLMRCHFSDRTLYPHLRQAVGISQHGNLHTKGWSLLLQNHRSAWALEASRLSKMTMTSPQGQVTPLQSEDVRHLFESPPSCWAHLFPHQHLVVAERPYSIMADNLPAIWNSSFNTQFYGTKTVDGGYSLLSAGSYHHCQVGINCFIDIFGAVGRKSPTDDFDMARSKEDPSFKPTEAAAELRAEAASDEQRMQTNERASQKAVSHAAADTQKFGAGKNAEIFSRTTTREDQKKHGGFSAAAAEQAVKVHGADGHQAVREHIIAHLQRLQHVLPTVTGKVVFSVYTADVLNDVMEDLSQDLGATKFDQGDDVCMFWARELPEILL